MRNRLYIVLEFLSGLGFSLAGLWIFSISDNSRSFLTSIFFGYIVMVLSMFLGVVLVGYFHFKVNNKLKELPKAIVRSFLVLHLFIGIYLCMLLLFAASPGFFSILIPLAGAVFGWNFNFKKLGIPI